MQPLETNENPVERLREALKRARKRKAVHEALQGTEPFAMALPLAVAALILSFLVFAPGDRVLPIALAAGALLAVLGAGCLRFVFALSRSAGSGRVAWELDRKLRLEDAFLTALEVSAAGRRDRFASALVEKTAASIDPSGIPRAFPVSWFRPGWAASVLLLAAAALVTMLPGPTDRSREAPEQETATERDRGPSSESAGKANAANPGGGVPLPTRRAPSREDAAKPMNDAPPAPAQAEPSPGGGEGEEETASKPPLLGEPERTPASFDDVKVKPLFHASGKSETREVDVPVPEVHGRGQGPAGEGAPERQLSDILMRYEKRAEQALSTGRIGKADRKVVLGYFDRVKKMLQDE